MHKGLLKGRMALLLRKEKSILLGVRHSVPAAVCSWLLGAVALAGAHERCVPARVSVGWEEAVAAPPPELVAAPHTLCLLNKQILTALLLSFLAKS